MPSSPTIPTSSRLLIPATNVALQGVNTPLGDLSVNASDDAQVALLITAKFGTLSAGTFPGATVGGGGTGSLWIAGSASDVNAKLVTLVYSTSITGIDTLAISLTDSSGHTSAPASLPIQVVPLITPPGLPKPAVTVLGGTLTLDTRLLDGPSLVLSDTRTGAGAASLILVNSVLGPNTLVDISSTDKLAPAPRLAIAGQVTLAGQTVLNPGQVLVTLAQNATLTNSGHMGVQGSSAQITGAGTLQNDGTIDISAAGDPIIDVAVTGSGLISLGGRASLRLGAPVSSGETITFTDNTGRLILDAPGTMMATIAGFVPGDRIELGEIRVDAADYVPSAGGGTLTLFDGAQLAATLHVAGRHQLGDFRITVATDSAPDGGSISTLSILANPPVGNPADVALDVYRFFDKATGTQLLTQDSAERDTVLTGRPDLTFEGVAMRATTADDPAAIPVYRFFDTTNGTHFFTASNAERDVLLASRPNLVFEPNSTLWEHASQQPGDVPVFRFFDRTTGTHFDTVNATERANILTTRPDLAPEGVAFFSPGQ